MSSFAEALTSQLRSLHHVTQAAANRQTNYWLIVRNWLVGYYVQQAGAALPGAQVAASDSLAIVARQLGLPGLTGPLLLRCEQFYLAYPTLLAGQTEVLRQAGLDLPDEAGAQVAATTAPGNPAALSAALLLRQFSFAHFLELLQLEAPWQRAFYELQAVSQHWSVPTLRQAIHSLLYERLGLSTDKAGVLAAHPAMPAAPGAAVQLDPYAQEFLGLAPTAPLAEAGKQALLDALETGLLSLQRGLCLEARHRCLSFDNEHFAVDLVFYHRWLRCHVLLDLQLQASRPADAARLNVYLNYYQEEQRSPGDQLPIGLVLSIQGAVARVRYVTTGPGEHLLTPAYQQWLPTEAELLQLLQRG